MMVVRREGEADGGGDGGVERHEANEQLEVQEGRKSLLFVQNNPLLRQIYRRDVEDGIFPAIKRPVDYWKIEEL